MLERWHGSLAIDHVTPPTWYDVSAKSSADGKPLAHKAGVYGNSTVVLEKQGNRYTLI